MLIPSANDAANVLAEHVSGSIANFADLMNEKAKEIGCENSHFTNPSGVHDENLYTTAYDLSLIARYAMQFETFRKIITTTEYTLPATDIYPKEDRTFHISNELVRPDSENYYKYANGIKTGFTNAAKDCLVASATNGEVDFIIVILGGNHENEEGTQTRYSDCKALFNFAFANYTSHYRELQQENEISVTNTIENSIGNFVKNISDSDPDYIRLLSKIIAVIIIALAGFILFIRRKKI